MGTTSLTETSLATRDFNEPFDPQEVTELFAAIFWESVDTTLQKRSPFAGVSFFIHSYPKGLQIGIDQGRLLVTFISRKA